MVKDRVSICIASFNMAHLLMETIRSCEDQIYDDIEIIVYDDHSTDQTERYYSKLSGIKYYRGEHNLGVGYAFIQAVKKATGEYIVLMCADDLFTSDAVIGDIVGLFQRHKGIGHVTRYYYQFVHGYDGPVRAWRSGDYMELANNPSGLAFRKKFMDGCCCSNRMFIETAKMVHDITVKKCYGVGFLRYDAIAARVHRSTSTKGAYWLKHRVSSPVDDWWELGCRKMAQDYSSFIQIKNGFTMAALWEEIQNFIVLRPKNLINPFFWFYAIVAVVTPRCILRKIPEFYRHRIGRLITRQRYREHK